MKLKELVASRGEYNAKLLLILGKLTKMHPSLRFGQILYNFGFITKPLKEGDAPKLFDPFHEEPVMIFQRVCKDLEKWGYTDILKLVKE